MIIDGGPGSLLPQVPTGPPELRRPAMICGQSRHAHALGQGRRLIIGWTADLPGPPAGPLIQTGHQEEMRGGPAQAPIPPSVLRRGPASSGVHSYRGVL
jgi:hypothetical protein